MNGLRTGTTSTPTRSPVDDATAAAGRRRKLLGTEEMETVRKGSPEDIYALLAALHAEGEIVSADEQDERDNLDSEDEDTGAETNDGPEDEDDFPAHMLLPDDNMPENEGVREALSFDNGNQGTCSDGLFTISFSHDGARFIPPRWATAARGVPTSLEARVLMFSLGQRFRFFDVLAAWLTVHRPRLVSTFALRYWAPDSMKQVQALYAGAGPNCLQQSMVKLLRQADPSLRLTEPAMSRYLGNSVAVHMGHHSMLLADLFTSRAQAIWAAAVVVCFIREHKLSLASLGAAEANLARGMIRPAADRVGTDPRAMRLQDFILFVQKPLSRTVPVSAVVAEARKLLIEDSSHA